MIRSAWLLAGTLIAGVSLSSCNKAADGDALALPESGIGAGRPEDGFGRQFAERFRADPNSEPLNVTDGEGPAVSLTTEPVAVD